MKELCIIGGGPAGISAGVYSARKYINTVIVSDVYGGQSSDSPQVENWIGEQSISGLDLGKKMEAHLRKYESDKLQVMNGCVDSIEDKKTHFTITLKNKDTFDTKMILYTAGSTRRKLPSKGADTFEHKGLTYCASCDGPLFTGQDVLVVGAGNSALETALQLVAYCSFVTLINRTDIIKGDEVTLAKLGAHDNFKVIHCAEVAEVKGDKFVSSVTLTDRKDQSQSDLAVTGIFVEIGLIPSTKIITDMVDMDDFKRIKIDPWTQRTSHPSIWAAGDCTNILYHQNNIASGNAVTAIENIYLELKTRS